MSSQTRRELIRRVLGLSVVAAAQFEAVLASEQHDGPEAWMNECLRLEVEDKKTPVGTLHVSRFVEPVWFLTRSIGWSPGSPDAIRFQPVTVPVGFITDLASIPRLFWSLLSPVGEYTYPAIIHDYLYWIQDRPREDADAILRIGMQEFGIDGTTVAAIYSAVRAAGGGAWNSNAELKRQGERRILRVFPADPRTRWEDWKKRSDVFEPQ